MSLENQVLKKIKPTATEEKAMKSFLQNLEKTAKSVSGLDVAFVGSIGKGTWLRGNHDIDLFVLFEKDVSREDLEKKGLAIGKKIAKRLGGKHIIKYAEHPYVQIIFKGLHIDVVPCYRIEKGEKIISAVDRSPLHLNFAIGNMTEKMMDETRLLKQFCKGIAVYGSDVKNQGFSGYICELLVIKYKTFLGVLKAASLWSAPQIIFFGEKPQKRFSDPLIIIDPTDACRNAAANVSADNFVKFVEKARQILKRPAKKYFFPEKPMPLSTKEIAELKKRGTLFVAIEMKKPGVIDDILYPQLRRSLKRLDGILRENEFVVVRSYEWIGKEMVLFFEMEVWSLPLIKKMVGPPIFSKVHSKEFLSKYSKNALFKPYVEDKRWVAERPREFIKATDLLSFFARKSMKDLEASGIPSYIAKPMKKSKIVENVWMLVKKQKDFSAFLHEKYFS